MCYPRCDRQHHGYRGQHVPDGGLLRLPDGERQPLPRRRRARRGRAQLRDHLVRGLHHLGQRLEALPGGGVGRGGQLRGPRAGRGGGVVRRGRGNVHLRVVRRHQQLRGRLGAGRCALRHDGHPGLLHLRRRRDQRRPRLLRRQLLRLRLQLLLLLLLRQRHHHGRRPPGRQRHRRRHRGRDQHRCPHEGWRPPAGRRPGRLRGCVRAARPVGARRGRLGGAVLLAAPL
mmetsp:Transcript_34264/g.91817  ORF Transcript_34264/g.91817 Transcript_34264/m.91817 type:complete len:229 (+) Transcript_34264:925-1611(+)